MSFLRRIVEKSIGRQLDDEEWTRITKESEASKKMAILEDKLDKTGNIMLQAGVFLTLMLIPPLIVVILVLLLL